MFLNILFYNEKYQRQGKRLLNSFKELIFVFLLANLSKNQFYNLTDVYFHQSIVYDNKTKIKYPLVSILNLGVEWKSENNIVKNFTTIGNTNKFLSIQIYILNFYRRRWKGQY